MAFAKFCCLFICVHLCHLRIHFYSSADVRRYRIITTEHTEKTEITAPCDDSCTSVCSVYSVEYDFQRHIDAKNVYKSDTQSNSAPSQNPISPYKN